MRTGPLVLLLLCAAPLVGCTEEESLYFSEARRSSGLVVILPGIEGPSPLNRDIREGLFDGGAEQALVIRPWGVPVPGVGALLNQMNVPGNRLAAAGVAKMIVEYQDSHPGQPVYVVGHSGGGGVAVFTAEALADLDANHRVDGLILLSASISGDYDLSKALGCSRKGLVNFYNRRDALLGATAVFGNVDGGRATSAGLAGFQRTFPGLYQVEVGPGLSGGSPHASTTRVPFVSDHVAPWIRAEAWPATPAVALGERGTGAKAGKDAGRGEARRGGKDRSASTRPKALPTTTSAPTSSVSSGCATPSMLLALAYGSRLNVDCFFSLFPDP